MMLAWRVSDAISARFFLEYCLSFVVMLTSWVTWPVAFKAAEILRSPGTQTSISVEINAIFMLISLLLCPSAGFDNDWQVESVESYRNSQVCSNSCCGLHLLFPVIEIHMSNIVLLGVVVRITFGLVILDL